MKPYEEEKTTTPCASDSFPRRCKLKDKKKKSRFESNPPTSEDMDTSEGDDDHEDISDSEEKSSKKRKMINLNTDITTRSPCFNAERPELPLDVFPLMWKDVLWKENHFVHRLVLYNPKSKKAYDGDYGFMIMASVAEKNSPPDGPLSFAFPVGKKKAVPLYLRRNRSTLNPLVDPPQKNYCIPHFSSEPPRSGEFRWLLAVNDDLFEYGFMGAASFTRLEIVKASYRQPGEDFSIPRIEQTFLKATVEDGRMIYFDIEEALRSAKIGNCLHKARYGEVYAGREMSEVTIPHPKDPSQTVSVLSMQTSVPVVIKAVALDNPLHQLENVPKTLTDVESMFSKTCFTENVVHEIQAMSFLQNQFPNQDERLKRLCQLVHYQADHYNLFAVTKAYQGGSLLSYMQTKTRFHKLTEMEAKYVFRQVVEAVGHLHSFGMSHLDISPENIVIDHESGLFLIDNGVNCVLIDFGQTVGQSLSSSATATGSRRFLPLPPRIRNVGKPFFHCPELSRFEGEYCRGKEPYCPQKVDIWQLGVFLYVILTGTPPFPRTENESDSNRNFMAWINFLEKYTIDQKRVRWKSDKCVDGEEKELRNCISGDAVSLLSRLLQLSPDKRPDISEILADDWLVK